MRQRSKDCQAAAELKTQISGSYSLQTVRFINAGTLEFIYVPDSELGFEENKYAVLSHRWGAARDEVSFQDIEESREYSHKKGFAKLKGFCDLASRSGCRYCWIDTCCINKGDAMEMNEAINSMYRCTKKATYALSIAKTFRNGLYLIASGLTAAGPCKN